MMGRSWLNTFSLNKQNTYDFHRYHEISLKFVLPVMTMPAVLALFTIILPSAICQVSEFNNAAMLLSNADGLAKLLYYTTLTDATTLMITILLYC
jgi:hypothetical protein